MDRGEHHRGRRRAGDVERALDDEGAAALELHHGPRLHRQRSTRRHRTAAGAEGEAGVAVPHGVGPDRADADAVVLVAGSGVVGDGGEAEPARALDGVAAVARDRGAGDDGEVGVEAEAGLIVVADAAARDHRSRRGLERPEPEVPIVADGTPLERGRAGAVDADAVGSAEGDLAVAEHRRGAADVDDVELRRSVVGGGAVAAVAEGDVLERAPTAGREGDAAPLPRPGGGPLPVAVGVAAGRVVVDRGEHHRGRRRAGDVERALDDAGKRLLSNFTTAPASTVSAAPAATVMLPAM